ncbi:hypothetical protein UlMin_026757 [Ulmus minor]
MAPPLTGLSLVSPRHPSSNGLTPLNSSIGLSVSVNCFDLVYVIRMNIHTYPWFLESGKDVDIAFAQDAIDEYKVLILWEIYVQLQESVRGCDVFLLQPTLMIDACRRDSAKNIIVVTPYFGYARADRKTQGRESIPAKLVANLITEAGANYLPTCDIHSGQSLGYFDIAMDQFIRVILDYLASKKLYYDDLIVVSPDVGGVARARTFAKKLSDAPLAIVGKRRYGHNVAEVMNLIQFLDDSYLYVIESYLTKHSDFIAVHCICIALDVYGNLSLTVFKVCLSCIHLWTISISMSNCYVEYAFEECIVLADFAFIMLYELF